MKGQPTAGFWRAVVHCALGCIVLALVTLACFRLQVGSTIPALLYLLAVVLVALSGSFAASVFVAVLAVLCLQYFFVAPLFSLRVADPMDAVAGGVFLATALAVTRLMTARRRAEKAQREQEALLDVTHDAIFVRSLSDDVITYWNRAAEESYGWSNGEAIGAVPHELLKTVFPVPLEEILAEVTRAGRWEGELVHTRRDGTEVVVASRWSLQHDNKGLPAAILETNNDITVRKRAEAELRASEEQWRDVFENNPTMYFMIDAAGTVLSVNPFGAEQLGYTVNELVGQPVLNVFHHSDREAVQREVALCLEQVGRARSWEARKVRKDGTVLPVRETAKAVPRVNGPIVLIACEDISERKRAEAALRRQANLLEQSHDAIFIWERPNRITYWNQGAEQLYGFSRDEAIGRASHELLQTVHPLPIPVFEAALERDGRWTGELTQTAHDGRKIIVESRQWLTREADGRHVVLETNRDITERKRAEDAWRQAEAELAHVTRVATMGELAASLAHELNQSLTGVVTNATASLRWLDREPPNREKATDAVRRIIRDANRASQVIAHTRGLLKKSGAGKAPLDLSEVLREILALAQPELTRHRIVLQEFLAVDLPSVLGVRVQLQQVALNLIMNGVEAMADLSDRSRELVIRSQRHEIDGGPGVVVAVQDAGTGIADETRDHLFEPFYTTKSHGLGMGLSISRSIIQAHGGRLWATPNAGAGATFQFVLPARSDPGP